MEKGSNNNFRIKSVNEPIAGTYRIRKNKSLSLRYDLAANERSLSDQPILNVHIHRASKG